MQHEKTVAYTDKTSILCRMDDCSDRVIPVDYHDLFSKADSPSAPTCSGRRLFVHFLTCKGLLNGAEMLILKQCNEDGDYHRDMSFQVYKTWSTRLIDNLRNAYGSDRAVRVLDNAVCHSKGLNQIPNSANTKDTTVAIFVTARSSI